MFGYSGVSAFSNQRGDEKRKKYGRIRRPKTLSENEKDKKSFSIFALDRAGPGGIDLRLIRTGDGSEATATNRTQSSRWQGTAAVHRNGTSSRKSEWML